MQQGTLVSIICLTYNHEKYIRETLEGFVNQKTNFKFEILIHDDASTDRTAQIIHEYEVKYPDLIKPIYQTENQYSKGGAIICKFLLPISSGKYLAFCEGDDYWSDERKLQKQVDILERESNCALVYTNCKVYNQKSHKFRKRTFTREIVSFEDLLINGNFIGTLTTCLRRDIYDQFYREICPRKRGWRAGDYPLWLYIFYNYRATFIPDYTSVYRELSNSASHHSNPQKQYEFDYNLFIIRKFFSDYSGVKIEDWDDNYELMKRYFRSCLTEYSHQKAATFRMLKNKTSLNNKKIIWTLLSIASYSKVMMKLVSIIYLK